jgi:hypothetical protein
MYINNVQKTTGHHHELCMSIYIIYGNDLQLCDLRKGRRDAPFGYIRN